MDCLRRDDGGLRIGALAREIGVSRQTLTRRFRAEVGLGPKAFARILRVERVVAHLRADSQEKDAASLAADLGFSDQAHLVREVKALTGRTPNAHRGAVPNLQDSRSAGR